MKTHLAPLLRIAGLTLALVVSTLPLQAQSEPAPALDSFFAALGSELESREVFAIDAKSVALTLGVSLGWPVSEDGVAEALGSAYQYGEIRVFLACEGGKPCIVADDGSHIEVTRAGSEEAGHVELRLTITRTVDGSVAREFDTLNLMRSDDGWRVVEGSDPAGA